jgi:hypothetical protein
MTISRSAHTWIFPIVMAAGALISGYRAMTGDPVGIRWLRSPGYVRASGVFGLIIALGLLVFWFVAVGPTG